MVKMGVIEKFRWECRGAGGGLPKSKVIYSGNHREFTVHNMKNNKKIFIKWAIRSGPCHVSIVKGVHRYINYIQQDFQDDSLMNYGLLIDLLFTYCLILKPYFFYIFWGLMTVSNLLVAVHCNGFPGTTSVEIQTPQTHTPKNQQTLLRSTT